MIPDKRVVWHPRRDDLFVVGGGTQITLYELSREYPEIRHVTSRHDLHHMRCFAWSPDSQLDDLIAVGTTTGHVDLIRLQASSHARSQNTGSQYSTVLSTGPTVPLAVRNLRACNALSFSIADPNYLAVGLDKVRGDPSLVIWDLTTTKPLLQIPGDAWLDPSSTVSITATPSMTTGSNSNPNYMTPAASISHSRTNSQSSTKTASSTSSFHSTYSPSKFSPFFTFSPLVIPRAIEPQHFSRTDPRILQQHATGEVVSALAFVPGTTHLLLAGISNRHFRFFDLRMPFTGGIGGSSMPSPISSNSSYLTSSITASGGGRGNSGNPSSGLNSGSNTGPHRSPTVSTHTSPSPHSHYSAHGPQPQSTPHLIRTSYTPSPLTIGIPATPAPSTAQIPGKPLSAEIANVPTKVQGIVPDPFEPYRIACWNGEEGIITIWDARKLKEPVLMFGERDASADGGYAFGGYSSSGHGSGECPVCGGYGSHVHHHHTQDGRRNIITGGSGAGSGVYIQAEWASARRGTIATLEKDARFVRVWDVSSARPYVLETEVYGSGSGSGSGSAGSATAVGGRGGGAGNKKSWAATLSWPRGEGGGSVGSGESPQTAYSPFGTGESYGCSYNAATTLILSDTRRTKSFPKILSSFALVPPSANATHEIVTRIMVVNKEGDLELYAMHDAPKQAVWSARGDLAVAGGDKVKVISAQQAEDRAVEAGKEKEGEKRSTSVSVKRGRQEESAERIQKPQVSREVSGINLKATVPKKTPEGKVGREAKEKEKEREARISETKKKENMVIRAVGEDISMVMKQRAVKGYSIGRPDHNADIIKEIDNEHGSSEALSELWLWIRHSQDILSGPTSRLNGYDFSFQGLSCIWEGFPPSPNEPLTMYMPAYTQGRVVAAAARQLYSQQHDVQGSHSGPSIGAPHSSGPYHPGMTTHQHSPTSTPIGITSSLLQTPTLVSTQLQYQQQLQRHQQMQMQLLQQSPESHRQSAQTVHPQETGNSLHDHSTHIGRGSLLFDVQTEYQAQSQHHYLLQTEEVVVPGSGAGGNGSGAGSISSLEVNPGSGEASLHSGDASGSEESPIITNDMAASTFGIGAFGVGIGGIGGIGGAGEMHSGWRDQAYQLALQDIISRCTKTSNEDSPASSVASWRPSVPTQKALQRHVALLLCGWSVNEDDLMSAIRRWEREGNYPRAACWLVFMKQYDKATELLMRSDDEAHRMMSGTLAALIPSIAVASTLSSPEAKISDLKMHCERMIVRLHDPYFRALLTHLTNGDWSEVLEEESLPFRERLSIAFQFLDDRALSTYLKRLVEQASKRGTIDSIMLTGLRCRAGIDVLQAYVDRTGDVQSAAVLSALTWPLYYAQQQSPMLTSSSSSSSGRLNYLGYTSGRTLDARPEKWLEAYRDLLDGFKLFHCRVGFDIERGQVMNAAIQNSEVVMGHGGGNGEVGAGEWVPGQIMIRCRYCGKTINGPGTGVSARSPLGKPTLCPHCNRHLPRCSICLMTLGIVLDAGKDPDSGQSAKDDGIVICQTCRHGGHATHIMEWFWTSDGRRNHETCAVADCSCRCADES